ncbi:hypothetical protein DUI87_05076 [Hirundo rustica rustica]|uniref:ribonuclease H n=1 Tax=Hirundo rustica rustica TaxID=333673 RepID=A0A3M0KYF5_HIRRU|nr:hypothetical protein DUI87_05076 [Hirundo rustica rustica]
MKRDETEETVLDMAKKLRTYADAMHGPTHARIAALETQVRGLADKMEENHKELKQDILQISAVQLRGSGTTRKHSLDREGKGIPRAKLWSFLRDCGENMKRWDGESTDAITQRLHELLDGKTVRGNSSKKEAAPVTQGNKECRPQFALTWRGAQYTWNRLPQGWKHSPTICHGLIQAALENGEAPEHLPYINDIIVWGNTAMEVFEKGEKIIQILLKAGFAIKKSKVKGPAREIQFLGVKWHNGRRQIPTEVINKITAMCPPTNKKETQAFLGTIGFWRMHIPEYSQIVSPLYLVTRKKNNFHWGPEQQQAFAQIKQEIAHAVALGPVRTGPDVKNVLYSAAGNNGLSWSLWQKVAQATEGEGGSSQLAELKAVQLALDIAEREKWPKLYLYTDSWMVASALWGWLEKWKKANWQRRGKPIWAADEWKNIATWVEKLPVKVRHVDAHVPKSRANEEHQNNEPVDQAAKIEVSKIDLDWQHKGGLFLARWAHDASGHQGRDATYKCARD